MQRSALLVCGKMDTVLSPVSHFQSGTAQITATCGFFQKTYQQGYAWANRLDEHLGSETLLHREVQGFESDQFRPYFNPVT